MYSYSKLSTYNQCPKKYKFSYIDKLESKTPLCFIKGRKIHKELEQLNENTNCDNLSFEVRNFLKSNIGKNIKNILLNYKNRREFKFNLDKDFKNCNKKSFFTGVIDLLYIDKILTLVDYKTGNYKDLKYQDFLQLMCYSLFFFNNPSIQKIRLRYIYIEHNLENELIIDRNCIENVKRWILDTVNKLENDNTFDCKYTILCDYCQYKNFCKK